MDKIPGSAIIFVNVVTGICGLFVRRASSIDVLFFVFINMGNDMRRKYAGPVYLFFIFL